MRSITSSRLSANTLVTTGVRPAAARRWWRHPGRRSSSWPACAGWAWRSSSADGVPSSAASAPPILLRSASRCATPKRCCSSMMASARFLNCTCSWITACVPTTSAASPLATSASMARALLLFLAAGEPGHRWPRAASSGSSQPTSLRKCCSARISVGAISAHCQPASMPWPPPARPPRSCPSPHRPAAAGAWARGGPGRARFLRPRGAARRSAGNGSTASSCVQAAGTRLKSRAPQPVALALALQLRQLLRQQLLGLQALPGRVAAVFQRGQGTSGAGGAKMIAPRADSMRAGGRFGLKACRERLCQVDPLQADCTALRK
jgi:hypothetical protein